MLTNKEIIMLKRAMEVKPVIKTGKGIFAKNKFIFPMDINTADYKKFACVYCDAPKLVKIGEFNALFRPIGYKGFFKPTIFDALAHIPDAIMEDVYAFDVKPGKMSIDVNDYVTGKVVAYGLPKGVEMPKEVKEQDVIYKTHIYSAKEIASMKLER